MASREHRPRPRRWPTLGSERTASCGTAFPWPSTAFPLPFLDFSLPSTVFPLFFHCLSLTLSLSFHCLQVVGNISALQGDDGFAMAFLRNMTNNHEVINPRATAVPTDLNRHRPPRLSHSCAQLE